MVVKVKKRLCIDIYQCEVYDKGAKTLTKQILRVKEGYSVEKLFVNENEVLCNSTLLETEGHDMILGIDLDDMTVSVLKDVII